MLSIIWRQLMVFSITRPLSHYTNPQLTDAATDAISCIFLLVCSYCVLVTALVNMMLLQSVSFPLPDSFLFFSTFSNKTQT